VIPVFAGLKICLVLKSLQPRHSHQGTSMLITSLLTRYIVTAPNPRSSVWKQTGVPCYTDFTLFTVFVCSTSAAFHFITANNLPPLLTRQCIPPQEPAPNWDHLDRCPYRAFPPTRTMQFPPHTIILPLPLHTRISLAYPAHREQVITCRPSQDRS
jgi:hypothetical protein